MKVYQQGPRTGIFEMEVCPGGHLPVGDCPSDWFRKDDGRPIAFLVQFVDGVAKVDDRLGRYMLKHGMAFKTSLILPPGLIAA